MQMKRQVKLTWLVMIGVIFWMSVGVSTAAAEKILASVRAPIGKFTLDPERWKDDTADGKAVVRLAVNTGYYSLPFSGAITGDVYILRATYYNDGTGKPFAIGVGGWKAPTTRFRPSEKGWCVAEAPVSASIAARELVDGAIKIIVSSSGNIPSVGFSTFELVEAGREQAVKAFRSAVQTGTEAAWKASESMEEIKDYDSTAPLAPSAEDTARGAIAFIRSYLVPVYPASVPGKDERTSRGALRMTPGEYEPFQFAVKALKDLPNCSATVEGALPKGLEAEVRLVECVPIRTAGGSSSKKWHVQPNRLWPAEIFPSVTVKQGDAQAWFVTFKADAKLAAGKYPVRIVAKSGSAVLATFSMDVTILPFSLPTRLDYAWGFYESVDIDRDWARDMAEHGCNSLSGWPSFRPAVGKQVDFTAWDAYFAMLKEFGIDHSYAWYMGTKDGGYPVRDDLGTEGVIAALKGIEARVKAGKYPKNFCVTIDEAIRNPPRFKDLKELFGQVKTHAPTLKRFGVALNKHEDTRSHAGMIDILSCNGDFAPNSAWCRTNQYGMYTYTVFTARSRSAEARYNAGFNPWRYGASGTYGWALRWYQGEPYNDLDSGGSDWGIALPSCFGRPIASPAWEGFREGVDDRRYVELYVQLVKAGKADGGLLDEIRNDLKEDKLSQEERIGDSVFESVLNNAQRMDKSRDRIIDAILKAQKK